MKACRAGTEGAGSRFQGDVGRLGGDLIDHNLTARRDGGMRTDGEQHRGSAPVGMAFKVRARWGQAVKLEGSFHFVNNRSITATTAMRGQSAGEGV